MPFLVALLPLLFFPRAGFGQMSMNFSTNSSDAIDRVCREIQTLPLPLPIANCEVTQDHGQERLFGGELSPFWAQELIGADFIREEYAAAGPQITPTFHSLEPIDIKSIEDSNLSPELLACKRGDQPPSALCLSLEKYIRERSAFAFDTHGTRVAQLVADPTVGVAAHAKLAAVVTSDNESIKLIEAATRARINLICNSATHYANLNKAFDAFNDAGGVFVNGAGNDFPSERYLPFGTERTIGVASLSPTGLVSYFSSPHAQAAIAAPSDNFLTAGRRNNFDLFSGTSGAQPLVCGAIANVIAFLPGITDAEIKKLMADTALPTVNSLEKPLMNGVGMLNAYKMFRVAARLKSEWPSNRVRLDDPQTLNFQEESQPSFAIAREKLSAKNNCERRDGLRAARRALLLDPRNGSYAALLRDYYASLGLHMNAQFYSTLVTPPNQADLERLAVNPNPHIRNPALRALSVYGSRSMPSYEKVLSGQMKFEHASRFDTHSYLISAFLAIQLGKSVEEVERKLLDIYSEPRNSADFNEILYLRLSNLPFINKNNLLIACLKNAKPRNTMIPITCVVSGLQIHFSADETALAEFSRQLEGHWRLVPEADLEKTLRQVAQGGPEGRRALEAKLRNAGYPPELKKLIQKVLDSQAP